MTTSDAAFPFTTFEQVHACSSISQRASPTTGLSDMSAQDITDSAAVQADFTKNLNGAKCNDEALKETLDMYERCADNSTLNNVDPVCWSLLEKIAGIHFLRQDYLSVLQTQEKMLQIASAYQDEDHRSRAYGNLASTYKHIGRFDEAIAACRSQLDISAAKGDNAASAREFYMLGNIYHAKGRQLNRNSTALGELSDDVRTALRSAIEAYERSLNASREVGDIEAEGRSLGNLGSTFYLLGQFDKSIQYHTERLKNAVQTGDVVSEKRACFNLANAYVLLSDYDRAIFYYTRCLSLSQELSDLNGEGQALYSLGSAYALKKDFSKARECHLRHVQIARTVGDLVGEGRGYWSLGNIHAAMSQHGAALEFALKHHGVCKQINDRSGMLTAEMNIADLRALLEKEEGSPRRSQGSWQESTNFKTSTPADALPVDSDQVTLRMLAMPCTVRSSTTLDEQFMETLFRVQASRLNDQRSVIRRNEWLANAKFPAVRAKSDTLMKLSTSVKPRGMLTSPVGSFRISSRRIEGTDRGKAVVDKEVERTKTEKGTTDGLPLKPYEELYEQLMRLQSNRLDDQRVTLRLARSSTV